MTTNNSINNSLPSGWTMTSTLINELLYSSSANIITGLATANSGLLITSAGGVPSISTTIPAGITMPQPLIQGVTNASNASAGNVGEYVTSNVPVASGVSLATTTPKDITTITLTAGDWDVFGIGAFHPTGTCTLISVWISTTSATEPDFSNVSSLTLTSIGAPNTSIAAPYFRFSSSTGSTTIYLSCVSVFSTGAVTASGTISARRVR